MDPLLRLDLSQFLLTEVNIDYKMVIFSQVTVHRPLPLSNDCHSPCSYWQRYYYEHAKWPAITFRDTVSMFYQELHVEYLTLTLCCMGHSDAGCMLVMLTQLL